MEAMMADDASEQFMMIIAHAVVFDLMIVSAIAAGYMLVRRGNAMRKLRSQA